MSNCFMPISTKIKGNETGPLSGLTFASKANIDVAGMITVNGSPDWEASHSPAVTTAPVVERLLAAGADLVGTAICDELCFSINGENAHYGTPRNPKAPGRIPGGSSSGSASAVACEEADFALGTDTSGSVRLPASYCGVFGIRGTHDLLMPDGVVPLARSFDALGWFARTPYLLRQIGETLWPEGHSKDTALPTRILVPEEALALCEDEVVRKFDDLRSSLTLALDEPQVETVSLGDLTEWREHLRSVQAREIWAEHQEWIETNAAGFGPGMEYRLRWGERVSDALRNAGLTARPRITDRLNGLLTPGTIMLMPTAPGPAPLLNTPAEDQTDFRDRAIALTCIASLAGLPEVSMPVLTASDCPVGLSLITARGGDSALVVATEAIWRKVGTE